MTQPPQASAPGSLTGAPAMVQSPKTAGLAMITLVCGLAGLVTCGLTGLLALVLGPIAIILIGQSKGAQTGRTPAVIGMIVGACSLAITYFFIFNFAVPKIQQVQYDSQIARGNATLQYVGMGLTQYADQNDGRLPESVEQMTQYLNQLGWGVSFNSSFEDPSAPAAISSAPRPGQNDDPEQSETLWRHEGYWLCFKDMTKQMDGDMMIAFSRVFNPQQQFGRHVLHLDGTVLWLTHEEFADSLEKLNELRRKNELVELKKEWLDDMPFTADD